MLRTNYYAVKINSVLKLRVSFIVIMTSMLFGLTFKLITPVRNLDSYKRIVDFGYGMKLSITVSHSQMPYIKLIMYIVFILGLAALSNNIYERFLCNRFNREPVIKKYDLRKPKYPYDPHKLQLILGLVHKEDSLDLSLDPNYVTIDGDGLFQNVLITGTIGTGKTATAIVQFALQLIYLFYDDMNKKCAMLFLDVKGTFYQFVYAFAKECGRWKDIITIELGGKHKYNPLHKPNLTEIELANRIRYILELFSTGGGSESYWIDKAESTIVELIKLIRIYNNGYVNFEELHKIGTNENYRNEKIVLINSWLENADNSNERKLNEEQAYNFRTALEYFRDEYDRLDEKGQGYIKSEITRMTGPFISTKIVKDTFCPSREEINFYGFEDVIREGKIVVWKINANKEPKIAKLIAAYLKLDYQKEIMISLEKKNTKEGKILADRIKVTVCDEYQEYVTKNDPDFFAQSREPRSITIAATQSYSSLKKSLHNDETMTSVLLQSLVNKIWLRSDDVDYTIRKVKELLDKVDREKVSKSVTESSRSSTFNNTVGAVVSGNKNISSSENIQIVKEEKFSVTFLSHKLGVGQSVCFVSDGKTEMKIYVVHLYKFFEGRMIFENGKITFTENLKKIFKVIDEAGTKGGFDDDSDIFVIDSPNNQKEDEIFNLSEGDPEEEQNVLDESAVEENKDIEICEVKEPDEAPDEIVIEINEEDKKQFLRDF